MKISLDKLPIRRVDVIEENGVEKFPSEVGEDEKRISLIGRIDFTPLVERDSKKAKTSKETTAVSPWPWQSLVENLQLAQQELSVIMDLISTVEANDAVAVAGMTRPKPLLNEVLSDLAVSTATKLQCFRHLGKYFKESANALEQQITREARFYGALIRLQQNWKIKRQRLAVASNSEGFVFDMLDNSRFDTAAIFRPSNISSVRIHHASSGVLAINIPTRHCRFIHFRIHGSQWSKSRQSFRSAASGLDSSTEDGNNQGDKEQVSEVDVDRNVQKIHSTLRKVHQAIFDEQVFEMLNHEAFYPSKGVNVIGIRYDCLQLAIGQEASVFLSLSPDDVDCQQQSPAQDMGCENTTSDENETRGRLKMSGFIGSGCYEIYLRQIFFENLFTEARERQATVKTQSSARLGVHGSGLLEHFCMTLIHRFFSMKVLAELENLVNGVPYLCLRSHPTWHSRISSWSLMVNIPQSSLLAGSSSKHTKVDHVRKNMKMRVKFCTKVLVIDESISVSSDGTPGTAGLIGDGLADATSSYSCNVEELPLLVLQQVVGQVICWLYEEAQCLGLKTITEFLGLSFELKQRGSLSLVAQVDPNDAEGCISWWVVVDSRSMEEQKTDDSEGEGCVSKKFLGCLALGSLCSILRDLAQVCCHSF